MGEVTFPARTWTPAWRVRDENMYGSPGLANDSRHDSTRQTRWAALALANITPPGDDHLRPSISCSLPDAAAFWVSSLPPRWTPPMKTLGTCLGPG